MTKPNMNKATDERLPSKSLAGQLDNWRKQHPLPQTPSSLTAEPSRSPMVTTHEIPAIMRLGTDQHGPFATFRSRNGWTTVTTEAQLNSLRTATDFDLEPIRQHLRNPPTIVALAIALPAGGLALTGNGESLDRRRAVLHNLGSSWMIELQGVCEGTRIDGPGRHSDFPSMGAARAELGRWVEQGMPEGIFYKGKPLK